MNWTAALSTIGLLLVSNVFMTIAWYGHLRLQQLGISANWPLYAVILFSWGIALVEYFFMIPANRIGFVGNGGPFSLVQMKVIQEVLSVTVFTILAMMFFKGEGFHWNHFVSFLLLVGAVFFAFLDSK